jgi:hypothetical protein
VCKQEIEKASRLLLGGHSTIWASLLPEQHPLHSPYSIPGLPASSRAVKPSRKLSPHQTPPNMGCGSSTPSKDYGTTSAASHKAARTKGAGDQRSEFDIGPGYKAVSHLGAQAAGR